MSNYRRLISYIYAYEGGVKGKNIGFAKIESRGIQCKIGVNVKKVYVGSNDMGVYLLSGDTEIFLGKIFIRNGNGEFRTVVSYQDVEHSGCSMDQCYGLTVHEVENAWQAYTTIWEDAVAQAAEVDLEEVTAENRLAKEMKSTTSDFASNEAQEQIRSVAEEIEEEVEREERRKDLHESSGEMDGRDTGISQEILREEMQGDARTEPHVKPQTPAYGMSCVDTQQIVGEESEEAQGTSWEKMENEESAETQETAQKEVQWEARKIGGDVSAGASAAQEKAPSTVGEESEALQGIVKEKQQMRLREPRRPSLPGTPQKNVQQMGGEELLREPRPEAYGVPQKNVQQMVSGESLRTPLPEASGDSQKNVQQTDSAETQRHNDNVSGRTVVQQNFIETTPKEMGPLSMSDPQLTNTPPAFGEGAGDLPRAHESRRTDLIQKVADWAARQRSESQRNLPPGSSGQSSEIPVSAEATVSTEPPAGTTDIPKPPSDSREEAAVPLINQPENDMPVIGNPQDLERLLREENEEKEESSHQKVWDQLQKEHAKIQAFDYEKGCEILTIKPQDIGMLPRENWVYGNNSFMLHGYYNYRYLILARLHNPNGMPRYLLGVPGHYYSNEKYMASMFGFPNFVLAKKQPSETGRFGYWYTDIKLGN